MGKKARGKFDFGSTLYETDRLCIVREHERGVWLEVCTSMRAMDGLYWLGYVHE